MKERVLENRKKKTMHGKLYRIADIDKVGCSYYVQN